MPARVAINGFGRIGRAALKIMAGTPELEVVAINDLTEADQLAYLLKYDSVYGRFEGEVRAEGDALVVDGRTIPVLNEKDPAALPWRGMEIDLVLECTGIFRTGEALRKHLEAGARKVVLSAPAKDDLPFVVPGVNEAPGADVLSTASCTTNCIAPVIEVVGRRVGIEKAMMTTVHAYTSSQALVDGPKRKWRRGRAAAVGWVPTTTGAARATTRALPQYEGRFDGAAIRGPVPCGSIADVTILTSRKTSVDEINGIMEEEAATDRYRGILGVNRDEIVSADILKDPHGSIVDLTMTQVVDGDLVKVMAWYDNEWGYAAQMVRQGVRMVAE